MENLMDIRQVAEALRLSPVMYTLLFMRPKWE
jgi:hypothetical protein